MLSKDFRKKVRQSIPDPLLPHEVLIVQLLDHADEVDIVITQRLTELREKNQRPPTNIYQGQTLDDYRNAPSDIGPLADEWADKPHRLVYDLCNWVQLLLGELQ